MAGEHVAAVISLWAEAVWNRRSEKSADLLAEDVLWEGAVPGTRCQGRNEVLALLHGWDRPPRLTRLEVIESGDRVAVFSAGPDLHAGGRAGPEGESYIVLTFSNGRISGIRSFASEADARASLHG